MPGGTELKNGFEYAPALLLMYAAWPMYAMRRHGKVKQSQDSCIALRTISFLRVPEQRASRAYLLLKAPRSAKRASTPVNASRIPPRDLQPSVLFRCRYAPAKYGEKAFNTVWSK